MSALAPRAAHVFRASVGERAFLKRPRWFLAVAPGAFDEMARDKSPRHVVAMEPSAPAQKPIVRAPALRPLEERMEVEHDAVLGLLKKAVHLSRDAGKNEARILAAKRRLEAPSSDAAAKRRKTSPSKPSPQAVHRRTEPEKQTLPDQQRAALTTTQRPMNELIDEAQKVLERRRLEEIARAREKFRQELLEVEKAAMTDETIYPEDLEELGLTAFEYAVTPTRKQARRGSG